MNEITRLGLAIDSSADIGGIGGFGELTTVSADGITQRIVERWPADALGAPLRHGPLDWAQWHRDNPKPRQVVTPLRAVGRYLR